MPLNDTSTDTGQPKLPNPLPEQLQRWLRDMLQIRSYTVLEWRTDDLYKLHGHDPETKRLCTLIKNKLDDVYAACHEMLGEHERAEELRNWAKRPARQIDAETKRLLGLQE